MPCDRNRTLQEIEGVGLGERKSDSALVETAHRLYRTPLADFTIEDLRLMIGQGIGLECLVPIALEELEKNPLAAGDYGPGDLLLSVLRIDKHFWEQHSNLYWRVREVGTDLSPIMLELLKVIDDFQSQNGPINP